ncbi:hypothetical protein PW52_13030 [Tamlana sedimentorum]|uniref:Zinc-ribbon domain-containing protein n=1 Tax=Neotamlana sedimentorum TaxID=1435349 RepID=A0A0D7W7L5_9FLAO|nr:putative zinc-binding metallopeptidase [Tamlana sedimentorum]KJD35014.1 hypothetical protein PW52_13030 [Tamlana sedimentorum]
MKIFSCPKCKSDLFFENSSCVKCHEKVGYNAISDAFESTRLNRNLKFCENKKYAVCNWLLPKTDNSKFCKACALNRKVPHANDIENFNKWKKLEIAKHRLIYQLIKLKLPLVPKLDDDEGIAFDFLSKDNKENKLTGHSNGVVTILLTEADAVAREQNRVEMNERYRTLLGHFRHEIGHYYWMYFFNNNSSSLNAFRSFFNDERQDYGKALQTYYNNGAPKNWNLNYISKYATSHPWEDWAETWAHYLHIMDTLETGNQTGIAFTREKTDFNEEPVFKCSNPYLISDFNIIFKESTTLTSAVNSLNRSMGLPDVYPFIVPQPVFKKLNFIHSLFINKS